MQKTCEVCKKQLFKYECPKCEIVYCSSACYKKHNDKCVNEFLNNEVMQRMKNNELNEFDKKDFKKKLKKFYEKGADSDYWWKQKDDNDKDIASDEEFEEETEVEENEESMKFRKKWCVSKKRYKMLTKLALDDKLELENLNDTEKKQFFSFLKSKNLDTYFKDFEPWWLDCVIKKVPNSKHLCCNVIKPSDTVIFIVIEVLYSYCYFFRMHHGEIEIPNFCYSILYLADSLNRESLPQTNVLNTINFLFQRIIEIDSFPKDRVFLYNVIIDVTKILSIRDLILRCLNTCKMYFKKRSESIQVEKEGNTKSSHKKEERLKEKSLHKYVYKKIKFLYSFSFYHYENFEKVKNELIMFYDQWINLGKPNKEREIVLKK